jgi:hypothetical protein
VTKEYVEYAVKKLKAEGKDATPERIVEMKIHGK